MNIESLSNIEKAITALSQKFNSKPRKLCVKDTATLNYYDENIEGFFNKRLNNKKNINFAELEKTLIIKFPDYRKKLLNPILKSIKDFEMSNIKVQGGFVYYLLYSNQKMKCGHYKANKLRIAIVDMEALAHEFPNKTTAELKKISVKQILNSKFLIPAFNEVFSGLLETIIKNNSEYTLDNFKEELKILYGNKGFRKKFADAFILNVLYSDHFNARVDLIEMIKKYYDGSLHHQLVNNNCTNGSIANLVVSKIQFDSKLYSHVDFYSRTSKVLINFLDFSSAVYLTSSTIGKTIVEHSKDTILFTKKVIKTDLWANFYKLLREELGVASNGSVFARFCSLVKESLGDLKNSPCTLDSTPLPTASHNIQFASLGHNNTDGTTKKQFKLTVLFSLEHHVPIYAQYNYGNSSDSLIGVEVLDQIYEAGYRDVFIINDRGFTCENFYNRLSKYNYKFVCATKPIAALTDLVERYKSNLIPYYHSQTYNNTKQEHTLIGFSKEIESSRLKGTCFQSAIQDVKIQSSAKFKDKDKITLYGTIAKPVDFTELDAVDNLQNKVRKFNNLSSELPNRRIIAGLTKDEVNVLIPSIDDEGNLTYSIDKTKMGDKNIKTGLVYFIHNFPVPHFKEVFKIYQQRIMVEVYNKTVKGKVRNNTVRAHSLETAEARHICSSPTRSIDAFLERIVVEHAEKLEKIRDERLIEIAMDSTLSDNAKIDKSEKLPKVVNHLPTVDSIKNILKKWRINVDSNKNEIIFHSITPQQKALAPYLLNDEEKELLENNSTPNIKKDELAIQILRQSLQNLYRTAREILDE